MSTRSIKFKRVAAAFDEISKDRRPCDGSSSGSEHWSEGTANSLSDLVNSFIECGEGGEIVDEMGGIGGEQLVLGNRPQANSSDELEREVLLKRLLGFGDDVDVNHLKGKVLEEISAWGEVIEENDSRDHIPMKCRRLMTRLRQRGYDAGICKSRWEKTSRYPAGSYEYIDIIVADTRYIVEVFPAGQFEIARPTDHYAALLAAFPPVFVGRVEDLKQIVRLMSAAMKKSLKSSGLTVAPWRTRGYLLAKWFSPYKRTTKAAPAMIASPAATAEDRGEPKAVSQRRLVGFEKGSKRLQPVLTTIGISSYCKDDFAGKAGVRIGLLAAAFQGK